MDEASLSIPASASDEEAAAIAAAVEAHLAAERAVAAAMATSTEDLTWLGRRWTFAGRLEGTTGRGARVPVEAPTDPWTAASRSDRF